jgi:hypothetical protein
MAGRVLNLDALIQPDHLGCEIARFWHTWDIARQEKIDQWRELREYIYATDTTTTTNSKLPWKNKTTIPKLCQIRDNLASNYMASLFPKRQWMIWEGADEESNGPDKRDAIQNYMSFATSHTAFKKEMEKLVLDYIDYGNVFVMPDWEDNTIALEDRTQVGYVGPKVKRISPLDIVFNPISEDFESAPKIVRSLISMGEIKEIITRFTNDENKQFYEDLYQYLKDLRGSVHGHSGQVRAKADYLRVDGFSDYATYLESDYCELLTFYGDIYDREADEFYRNHVIIVVDRHKVLHKAPNPSIFGKPPIFHVGWRLRQDNLWAMGPLENLVGMQYRIDHIENLKADVFDLHAFPPLKIKGYVEDFEWGPNVKVFVGDEGDVEPIAPQLSNILNANVEIAQLEAKMEEMAGAPKEAMGFRSPGEKTKYEVQRLENAASRIFTAKITQFEEKLVEPLLNAMLDLARRRMNALSIRVFDDELKFAAFQQLTPEDIAGNGRLRPVAARHFAEKAERIQNLTNFFQSPVGQSEDINMHWSGIKLSKLFEQLLDVEEYEIVQPYVRLSERADAQRFLQSAQEQVMVESQTPSGLTPDDYSEGIESDLPPEDVDDEASEIAL